MPKLCRETLQSRVVVVTPRGWRAGDMRHAPHNRWPSILETVPGKLTYDTTRHEGAKQFWGKPFVAGRSSARGR